MDIVAFIEEYFGIQLLTYQKLQLRMLMMEYAKYEGLISELSNQYIHQTISFVHNASIQ